MQKESDEQLLNMIEAAARVQQQCYMAMSVPAWRSFDGTVRRISDMTTSHIINSLGVLAREQDDEQSPLAPFLEKEYVKRLNNEPDKWVRQDMRKLLRRRCNPGRY